MSKQSNNHEQRERKHTAVGAYPLVFLALSAALGIYLGVILYSSPGKVKKAGKYDKTVKSYEKKPNK